MYEGLLAFPHGAKSSLSEISGDSVSDKFYGDNDIFKYAEEAAQLVRYRCN